MRLFLQSRQATGASPGTIHFYNVKLGRFLAQLDPDKATRHDIETFLLQFDNLGNRHAYFRAIRTFYRWREESFSLPNPMMYMKAPSLDKPILPSLTRGQVLSLIQQAQTLRDRAIIALLTESGLRLSELASIESAKAFLSQFLDRKTTTLARYTQVIGRFMRWYGEPLDFKVRQPKELPQVVHGDDVDKMVAAMSSRRTHKGKAERDIILVETARLTGMRRFELANLTVGDIDFFTCVVVVRGGKGEKDRAIPLAQSLAARLESFCGGKGLEESVFDLAPSTISNKIRTWADKAGVSHIHANSLRHEFGTRLAQRGVGARTIQALLGHSNMSTSQCYIDVVGQDLKDAVETLEKPQGKKPADHGKKSALGDTRLETVSIDVDPEYVYTIASFGGSMYIGSHYRHNQERLSPD